MANLRISWVLPTTRESGKPLNPADIAGVLIELSADRGASYVVVGNYPPNVLQTLIEDVDYGDWFVRGTVQDTAGRLSLPVVASINRQDTTNPGVVAITLTLE